MFRFRDPKQPPRPPQPWHAHAKRCCGFAARNALLGAAAAAKASADAMRWAAEGRQAAKPHPMPVGSEPIFVSPTPPILAAVMAPPPRPRATPAPRCGKSSSKVLPILALALLVGFVVALSGVKSGRRDEIVPPPAAQNMARLSPAKLTDYSADNAVVGGAKAALKALEDKAKQELTRVPQPLPPVAPILPIPPLPPAPPKAVPTEQAVRVALHLAPDPATVKTRTAVKLTGLKSRDPQTTKEAALADALLAAQAKIAEQFARLDPPLDAVPTVEQIRRDYLKPESLVEVKPTAEDREAWAKADLNPDRFWVTVDVEVSEDQVRQLRGERRLATAAPIFLLPLLLAGGLWGFLRLDALSKGHLTGVLVAAVGAVVIGGSAFATYFARW